MISEIVILGGLVWSYCSVSCQQRMVHQSYEKVEKHLEDCEKCLNSTGPRPVTSRSETPPNDGPICIRPVSPLPRPIAVPARRDQASPVCVVRPNPGKITNNSWINFMRELRKCNANVTFAMASPRWANLSDDEKMRYQLKEYRKRN